MTLPLSLSLAKTQVTHARDTLTQGIPIVMKNTLSELLTSKKFLAVLAAILSYAIGQQLGVDQNTLQHVWVALLGYAGFQGIADFGKSAAQVGASTNQATSDATNSLVQAILSGIRSSSTDAASGAAPTNAASGATSSAAQASTVPPPVPAQAAASSSGSAAGGIKSAALSIVALFLPAAALSLGIATLTACGATSGHPGTGALAGTDVVECAGLDTGPTLSAVNSQCLRADKTIDFSCASKVALGALLDVGGCTLLDLIAQVDPSGKPTTGTGTGADTTGTGSTGTTSTTGAGATAVSARGVSAQPTATASQVAEARAAFADYQKNRAKGAKFRDASGVVH